jgi:choline dehydrogenase-like flavoprotein
VSGSDPDFLVIGAGAAGDIVAKELATAGFRVVVLEQGPWLRERDFKHDELWANCRHALTNDPARQPHTRHLTEAGDRHPATDRELRAGRRRRHSVHFTANYWRMHELDFVERSRRGALAVVESGEPFGAGRRSTAPDRTPTRETTR